VFAIVRHAAVIPIGSTLCDTVITTSPGHVESSAARVARRVRPTRLCLCQPWWQAGAALVMNISVIRERGCFVLVCLVLTHAGVRQLMIAPHGFAV